MPWILKASRYLRIAISFSAAVNTHRSFSGDAGNRIRTTNPKPTDINPRAFVSVGLVMEHVYEVVLTFDQEDPPPR